jgi:hypothetical protein
MVRDFGDYETPSVLKIGQKKGVDYIELPPFSPHFIRYLYWVSYKFWVPGPTQ